MKVIQIMPPHLRLNMRPLPPRRDPIADLWMDEPEVDNDNPEQGED